MKKQTDLFDLIRSLTPSEKRYFRLNASCQRGQRNYMDLFDAIEAQSRYDENALRATFAGRGFVKQMHVAKHYLYELILESLRSYHDALTIDLEIDRRIHDARILREKRLWDQYRNRLEEAETLAVKYGRDLKLLEITELREEYEGAFTEEAIERRFAERAGLLDSLRLTYGYSRLNDLVMLPVMDAVHCRREEDIARLDHLLESPLLHADESAVPLMGTLYYYLIRATADYHRGHHEGVVHWMRHSLLFFDRHPHLARELSRDYIVLLNNLLIALNELRLDDAFLRTLQRLKDAATIRAGSPLLGKRVRATVFDMAYGLEFSFYFERGNFDRCLELTEEIETGLRTHKEYISSHDVARFLYLISYLHFTLGNHMEALKRINICLHYEALSTRRQVYYWARLLSIMIHVELGNLSVVESQIRSTYRYLLKHNGLHPADGAVLRYLRRLPDVRTRSELIDSFSMLRKELIALEPTLGASRKYLDYIAWLDSKILNRPMRELVTITGQTMPSVTMTSHVASPSMLPTPQPS